MAITLVGSDSADSASGGSQALTLPSHQADDFGLIFCMGDEDSGSWSITVATGWTLLAEFSTAEGADRHTAIFYKKFTSGSETNPTASYTSTAEESSATVHVFRGVDTTDPWGSATPFYSRTDHTGNDVTPPNPSITTDQNNSALVVFCGQTHNEMTAAGAPSGYTLGAAVVQSFRNNTVAYLLDSGTSGLKSPGDWTHSGTATNADSTTWTVALNPATAGSTDPGDRFVRRHNAARTSTSNTTAADITYDTAVLSEGGYSWASPEVTVDTTGLYLCVFDLGQVDLSGSDRAVGTLVPSVNTTDQTRFRATHRYLRNSGGAIEGASIGMCVLDLTANDDVKVRNPGVLAPTDAVGNYATNASYGGGLQMIRLNAGNFTHVERTTGASEVGTSNINTTRPWLDSSGTWTTITYNSEVNDDDSLYPGTGGDLTLAANTKYLVVWGATITSTDASRHTDVVRLQINSNNVQTGSGYQRNTASNGPPICGMYLHETGGTTETCRLQATHETEGGDAGTPTVEDAYLQVVELPSGAEWIHVDNGTTDSLTTALAGLTTWYDTPLSSTFRADGDSNLSLDGTNNAVQNDSGGSLPVLAIGWHRWDRDAGGSGTRKNPWTRWDNGGAAVGYGVAGAYSRGQQSGDDTWQAHYVSAVTLDLANAADLSFQVQDEASAANSDMGIYASTASNRHFLGVQVLNLDTLAAAGPQTLNNDFIASSYTVYEPTVSPGAVTLTADFIASSYTVYEPTLTSVVTLSADFIAATSTTYEPTVSPGAATLTADFISSSYQVFEPNLIPGAVTLTSDYISTSYQIYEPTLTPSTPLNVDFIASSYQTFEPVLTPGAVTLSADYIVTSYQIFEPTLAPGAVTLTSDFIASSYQTFEPTLTPGAVTLSSDYIATSYQIYEPDVNLVVAGQILCDYIPSGNQLYEPTLTPGPVTLTADYINTSYQIFEPTLLSTFELGPDFISSGNQVFEPEVTTPQPQTLDSDFISSSYQIFEPNVTTPSLEVEQGATDDDKRYRAERAVKVCNLVYEEYVKIRRQRVLKALTMLSDQLRQ